MGKLLSVIVPVYNTENYLNRCIDSIVEQTYNDIELILIDDGSTDKSGKICDLYLKKDKRIKVIHTKNQGQSMARNIGLDVARGKYITFVDSDDWIEKKLYKKSIELLEKENADIVDYECKLTKKYETSAFNVDNYKILKEEKILEKYLEKGVKSKNAPFSPCRKIYLSRLFNDVRFPNGKINEDIATIYKVLTKSKIMIAVNSIGYYYYQSGNSTTVGGLKQRDFDLLDACNELSLLTLKEKNKKINYYAEVKKARCYFSLLAKIAYYGIAEETIDEKKVTKELLGQLRKKYFLLMKSPININRKIIITSFCINYNFTKKIINLGRKIKK